MEQLDRIPCPRCRELITPLPIRYGYPGPEMIRDAAAGRIRLGGCVVGAESPDFACPECDALLPVVDESRRGLDPVGADALAWIRRV